MSSPFDLERSGALSSFRFLLPAALGATFGELLVIGLTDSSAEASASRTPGGQRATPEDPG